MQTVDGQGAPSCGNWNCDHDAEIETQQFTVITSSLHPVKPNLSKRQRPKQSNGQRQDSEQSLHECMNISLLSNAKNALMLMLSLLKIQCDMVPCQLQ